MEDFRAGGAADGTSGDGDPEDASAPALEGIEITEVFEEAELRAKYLMAASLVGKEKWAVKAEYRKECTGNVLVLEDEYG